LVAVPVAKGSKIARCARVVVPWKPLPRPHSGGVAPLPAGGFAR